jgi:hypothetical protein
MPYKVTSKDQIGNGAAKKATEKVETRKSRNRSALELARRYTSAQGTDKANSSKAPKPTRR